MGSKSSVCKYDYSQLCCVILFSDLTSPKNNRALLYLSISVLDSSKEQEVAVKKFLDQDFSGAALAEFKREVWNSVPVLLYSSSSSSLPNFSSIDSYIF